MPSADPQQAGTNPYQAPIACETADPVDPAMASLVPLLVQTRPWVLFFGILGLIVCCLVIATSVIRTVPSLPVAAPREAGQLLGAMLFNILFWGIGCLLSAQLLRYSRRISDLRYSRKFADLEAALSAQKSFWKSLGVAAIVLMVFMAISVLVALGS